jgi:pimeloyl-ACP methyl ester carboxylesterase
MYCDVGGIRFYYEVVGSGKPVIMLHGYSLDHHVMRGCMEPVFRHRHGYKRIYFDLPGHGRTHASDRLENSDQMLELVSDFIRKTAGDGEFLVAGESYGGYLARGLIYHMPGRVDGALLICPVIVPEHSKRELPPQTAMVKDEELIASLKPIERENFELMATVQDRKTWKRFDREMMTGKWRENPVFGERFQKHGYPFSFDVDRMPPFSRPFLLFAGRQDAPVGCLDHLNIVRNFPRGTFAILDRAGHSLPIEQEKVFNSLVGEWLDRVEEITRHK